MSTGAPKLGPRMIFVVILGGVGLGPMLLPLSGCDDAKCVPERSDLFGPAPSLDCASGNLCYQGDCYPACDSNLELADECETDSDCHFPARPFCKKGLCSACEGALQCVRELEICAEIQEVQIDAGNWPSDPGPCLCAPFDGGPLDLGYYPPPRPPYVDPPPPLDHPATHTGTVVIAQRTHALDADRREGVIELNTAVIDRQVPHASWTSTSALGDCVVTETQTWGSSVDFGRVIVNMPSVVDRTGNVTFRLEFDLNAQRYRVSPEPPAELLPYSDSSEPDTYPEELRIAGLGNELTKGRWPDDVSQGDMHIPRRLEPTPESQSALNTGLTWNISDPQPIALEWQPQFFKSGTRLSMMERGVTVRLRIEGPGYVVDCRQDEESQYRVRLDSRAMQLFLALEGFSAGNLPSGPLPLYFERVFEQRMSVRDDTDPNGVTIHMAARVSDTHVSQISIVP